jgi:hypothetical protein
MNKDVAIKNFSAAQREKTIKAIGLLNYNSNFIAEKMNTDYIFAQFCEDKVSVLRHIIETIENRVSTDDDWRQLTIEQMQGNEVSMVKKEEIYYKQKHVGTITFRMENFTAHFDFVPAQNNDNQAP